jgi:hypothetical protein
LIAEIDAEADQGHSAGAVDRQFIISLSPFFIATRSGTFVPLLCSCAVLTAEEFGE